NFRRRVEGHIKAIPGAVELIKAVNARGFKQAIASSAPPENIEVITHSLKIEKCFQATAYGLEVPEGKPSPQIYLLAAKKLGVKPANCVVMEDAIAGVEGAKNAGMKCVAVATSHPEAKLQKADRVVATPAKITVDDLIALFK
ncbi:MAG TPA: HAD family phosphatase, partial [Dehalococcoidales bacterium]|nr:HAD family phosphatase [Dehalococcoidales bacterium]